LTLELHERVRFTMLLELDRGNLAGFVLRDEDEVENPDRSARGELGEGRSDLAGELAAGKSKDEVFHGSNGHAALLLIGLERSCAEGGRVASSQRGERPRGRLASAPFAADWGEAQPQAAGSGT